jgi:hypothetical protein
MIPHRRCACLLSPASQESAVALRAAGVCSTHQSLPCSCSCRL